MEKEPTLTQEAKKQDDTQGERDPSVLDVDDVDVEENSEKATQKSVDEASYLAEPDVLRKKLDWLTTPVVGWWNTYFSPRALKETMLGLTANTTTREVGEYLAWTKRKQRNPELKREFEKMAAKVAEDFVRDNREQLDHERTFFDKIDAHNEELNNEEKALEKPVSNEKKDEDKQIVENKENKKEEQSYFFNIDYKFNETDEKFTIYDRKNENSLFTISLDKISHWLANGHVPNKITRYASEFGKEKMSALYKISEPDKKQWDKWMDVLITGVIRQAVELIESKKNKSS